MLKKFKTPVNFIAPDNEESGINNGNEFVGSDGLLAADLNKMVANTMYLEGRTTPINRGGTGAADAAGARANLGAGAAGGLATLDNDGQLTANQIPNTIARINNPNFTGEPTVPTPPREDRSTRIATTEFVASNATIGGLLVVNGLRSHTVRPSIGYVLNLFKAQAPENNFDNFNGVLRLYSTNRDIVVSCVSASEEIFNFVQFHINRGIIKAVHGAYGNVYRSLDMRGSNLAISNIYIETGANSLGWLGLQAEIDIGRAIQF